MSSPQVKILSPQSQLLFVSGWYALARDSHFWMKGRLLALLKQFQRNHIPIDQPWRGLEIGCGHGVLRSQIERHTQWTVDGADLDLNSLKENPRCRGELYLYNILERQDIFKEHFDFIILYDVIEHIENVKLFLEASLFHLKDGGYVFINVPALESLYSNYDKIVGHQRRYDRNMLAQELQQVGLKVIHINYWGFVFLPLLLFRKIFVARDTKEDVVVQKGFSPQHPLANFIFKVMIQSEVALMPNPVAGTSVMAIARKES